MFQYVFMAETNSENKREWALFSWKLWINFAKIKKKIEKSCCDAVEPIKWMRNLCETMENSWRAVPQRCFASSKCRKVFRSTWTFQLCFRAFWNTASETTSRIPRNFCIASNVLIRLQKINWNLILWWRQTQRVQSNPISSWNFNKTIKKIGSLSLSLK